MKYSFSFAVLIVERGVKGLEDKDIVELFWRRNENAIGETEKKYSNLLFRIAENVLRQKEDSLECVNETYWRIWNSIPTDRPEHYSAYICKIVKNLALKRLAFNNSKKRKPEALLPLEELGDCVSGEETVESAVDVQELSEAITAFLQKQSGANRAIFLSRYWYYDSVNSIAERLNLTENNVSLRLHRIRKELKIYLRKEGFEL